MRSSKVESILQISLVIWAFAFALPQFMINIVMHLAGVSIAYLGFYWIFHAIVLMIFLLIAWKYEHPLAKLAYIPTVGIIGYIYFRYLQPEYMYFNPMQMIFNVIILGVAAINILYMLFALFFQLVTWKLPRKFKNASINKTTLKCVIILASTIALLMWSYVGFSMKYTITNSEETDFRVSFWGYPSAGINIANYGTPTIDAEMAIYRDLNTSFFFGMSHNTLTNAIMDWVDEKSLTNFRGISLDIEGPKYRNESYIMSSLLM